MGLLEYHAMPFLRDVAHEVFCVHLEIYQPQTGASVMFRQGRHGWSITYTLLGHTPRASQAGRRIGPALYPSAALGETTRRKPCSAVCTFRILRGFWFTERCTVYIAAS
jgi:hypothetical protein